MGYNGNNRKTVRDMQQGFSKSADRAADRFFFGPKYFRNSVARIIIAASSKPSPTSSNPRKAAIAKDAPTDTDIYIAKGTLVEQKLYKCDCGKISSLEAAHAYCPSCGRWLSQDKIISENEAIASSQGHSTFVTILVTLSIIVFFLLIFICI